MNGFVPFLDARNLAAEEARSALPDSPARPEPPDQPGHDLRLRISRALHRLADRLEPASPPCPEPPGASSGIA